MGLCITAKFTNAPHYHMGYGSFMRLRNDIASAAAAEFGEHYKNFPVCPGSWSEEELRSYDKTTGELIKKYKLKNRFLDFLYYSDCEGKLSPSKCAAVLKYVEKIDPDKKYGYVHSLMTMSQFADLLRSCCENKKYLIWY